MRNIRLLNESVAVCRSDMPSLTFGLPQLDNATVEAALFELVSIRRWHHLAVFADKWAPYDLPRYSSGGILWERPRVKSDGSRSLSGSVTRVCKSMSIECADKLEQPIAWFEEQLGFSRADGAIGSGRGSFDAIEDEFDMRLHAIDVSIDQSSAVLGVEELLAHRDMLILACKLYRGFLNGDLSDELFAQVDYRKRLDGRIQIGFLCEKLCLNKWIYDRYCNIEMGGKPATLLMGNMPAWEALSLEVDFSSEKARKSFYVICPECVNDANDAIRYAASVFAAALVNENIAFQAGCDGGSYMNRSLFLVSEAGLLWQVWRHLGSMFDARTPIGECVQCGVPIPAGGALYCSDACKTAASKARRDAALMFALAGKPLEEAIAIIGERYRSNIERWYEEASFEASK